MPQVVATFGSVSAHVSLQFNKMSSHELFVTDISGDELWEAYLAAFPPGSNPMFRKRTEHDCSCCRNFIKNLGNVVTADMTTVWDVAGLSEPYSVVAETLSTLIKSKKIVSVFRTKQQSYGAAFTWEDRRKWEHFHGTVAGKHLTSEPDKIKGEINSIVGVFRRSLEELKPTAVAEVVDLIENNSVYRGAEFKSTVLAFQRFQRAYLALSERERELTVWSKYMEPFSRIKNTVIGTLIQAISEGMSTEAAVTSFEAKVAPANYKRPTSLVTAKMVAQAAEKLKELGLEDAIQRRFAKLSDVSVNNVLFVDNNVRSKMKDGGLVSLLANDTVQKPVKLENAEPIAIGDFISKILPTTKSMSLLVENSMDGNFVSLTAPAVADSGKLLKWSNDFAWAYTGNVTDSIKERVHKAGGNINAVVRCSLAWFNHDDLDIHVHGPGDVHIYFANKDGKLDVDMNAHRATTRSPVENVSWKKMPGDGTYHVKVNQYSQREKIDVGFVVELEVAGHIRTFRYPKQVVGTVGVLSFIVKKGEIVQVSPAAGVSCEDLPKETWGVKTLQLTPVDSIMLSPNYWDDNATGNKHWFFMLHGCKNPDSIRGLYNEFLNPALEPHRKVFEILGDKLKCPVSDDQLSGVGFSSTRKDSVKVVVNGAKAYNIQF